MSSPTVAVIHTSPATVEVFAKLLSERLPDARVINFLDDSVLPQLSENGGDIAAVAPRWHQYARTAKERGATVILNACSSIGELCTPAQQELGIPVIRVDTAMAEKAVADAQIVVVVATLSSTLGPTSRLLAATARTLERDVDIVPLIVDGAYAALIAGEREKHDDLVSSALAQAASYADKVVLAQASMARVLPRLCAADRAKCLVSPELAVASLVKAVRAA